MRSVDVDDLYGLPFDEFVPARNVLARELRQAGKRDEAAEVAALRKPSVAAWAVDQLVRTQRKAVSELFDAGDALRGAQDDVLAGRGDGQTLRAAVERERGAVDALAASARGLLTADGHELSPAIIERVADTLHAAALDDEAREQVREGRLERELRHVGLGPLGAAPARAPARPGSKKTTVKKPATNRAAERSAREERERGERARAAARTAEREARRRADHAERAQKVAAERRDRAAEALTEAEAELDAAETELREAQAQLASAHDAARDAGRDAAR